MVSKIDQIRHLDIFLVVSEADLYVLMLDVI